MQLNGNTVGVCWMYNYYPGTSNNSSCSAPTPGTVGNNGNVLGYNYLDTAYSTMAHSAPFGYNDGVNRLTSVISGTGSGSQLNYTINYQYDVFGNMTCTYSNSGAPCPQETYTNNRVNGYTYDAAGNVLYDGAHTYQWDAEGRLVSMYGVAGQACQFTWTACLIYNGEGWAAWRSGSAGGGYQQLYLFDPAGNELADLNGQNGNWWDEYVRANGRIIADYGGSTSTYFFHPNLLGSTSVVTDYTGTVQQDLLFYPWGQKLASQGITWDLHFAGFHEFFADLNLYPTPTRLYPPAESRWLSPDPGNAGADPSDPQTWNMYAYAGNNPTTNTDPTGETYHVCQTDANGNQSNCTDISDEQFGQFQQENKDTLTFTGNGNVLQNGTVIGSYQQTSVDLSPFASDVIAGVNANHPGDFIAGVATQAVIAGVTGGAADAFLGGLFEGLGLAGEGTQTLGIAGAEGASSDYIDVTRPGSVRNIQTNVSATEFGNNLKAQGFKESVEGNVIKYTKGNTQYTVYSQARSTGGPTAQVKVNGTIVAKIRLQ